MRALALAALAALASCGGGEKPVAAPPPPLDPEPQSCPAPAAPEAPHARTVPMKLVESRRTAGVVGIAPPEATKVKFHEQGISAARAEVLLCLDEVGAPRTTTLATSSCVPDYDAQILKAMAEWRFRPFEIDGAPSPVCTTVVFVYRQEAARAARGATTDF